MLMMIIRSLITSTTFTTTRYIFYTPNFFLIFYYTHHCILILGFYANLLTKNVAMGNDVDKNAISVYTAGSIRHNHLLHSESTTSSSASTTTTTATLNSSSIFNANNKVNNDDDNSDFIIGNIDDKYVNGDLDKNEIKKSSLHFNKEKYINKNLSSTVVVQQELMNNNYNAIAITSIPTSNDNNFKSDKNDDVDKSKLVLSKSNITNHNDNEISLSTNGSNSSDVIINETITKVEVILSARERYLERKRKNVDYTV